MRRERELLVVVNAVSPGSPSVPLDNASAGCPAAVVAAQPVAVIRVRLKGPAMPFVTNAQLTRLEIAVARLRDDLRLKEQQDRIEAQQVRIESQLEEVLTALDELNEGMTPEQQAEVNRLAGEVGQQVDELHKDGIDHTPKV